MKDTLKFTFIGPGEDGKPVFYINKEKRTVVCKITGILKGFSGEVESDLVWNHPATDYSGYGEAEMTFTGKAKCCPDDEWNETVGRQIAESRAKMKAYAALNQIASNSAEFYRQQSELASNARDKYLAILATEAGRVVKLAKED